MVPNLHIQISYINQGEKTEAPHRRGLEVLEVSCTCETLPPRSHDKHPNPDF